MIKLTPKGKRWADRVKAALLIPDGDLTAIQRRMSAMRVLVKHNPRRYSFVLSCRRISFQDNRWLGRREAHCEDISHYSSNLMTILSIDLKDCEIE